MYRVNIYTMTAVRGLKAGRAAVAHVLECTSVEKAEPRMGVRTIEDATPQRAELIALIDAMRRMTKESDIDIYTESDYVANGFDMGWVENWKANSWRRKGGTEVANREEWEELDRLLEPHNYNFHIGQDHAYRILLRAEAKRMEKEDR